MPNAVLVEKPKRNLHLIPDLRIAFELDEEETKEFLQIFDPKVIERIQELRDIVKVKIQYTVEYYSNDQKDKIVL
jgi:hypothetical protein